jgi:hypothetical protein
MTLDAETEAYLDRLVAAAPGLTERQSAELRQLFAEPDAGET